MVEKSWFCSKWKAPRKLDANSDKVVLKYSHLI